MIFNALHRIHWLYVDLDRILEFKLLYSVKKKWKLRYSFHSLKAFIPKPFMLQQHNRNSGV